MKITSKTQKYKKTEKKKNTTTKTPIVFSIDLCSCFCWRSLFRHVNFSFCLVSYISLRDPL